MNDIKYYKNIDDFLHINKGTNKDFLLFVSQNCKIDISLFKNVSCNIHGAIFPNIIFESKVYKTGLMAFTLEIGSKIIFEKSLKNPLISSDDFINVKSIISIVDGFSEDITPFLENLFEKLEDSTQIIGGGAADMSTQNAPVIFNKKGIYNNAALLICKMSAIGIGVQHGWKTMEGPFVVTSSSKNILQQIDYKNAFDVYKEVVEKDCGKKITQDNFFDISKSYPIGIIKFEGEVIVRDPIKVENNNLIVVGDIPVNSVIYILNGNKKTLIKAASKASKMALKSTKNEITNVLIFDCKSREMFLGDDFELEINKISKKLDDNPIYGAITIGEIANSSDTYINFFNKTCVVGLLC